MPALRRSPTLDGAQIVFQWFSKAGVSSPFRKYGTVLVMKLGTTLYADVRVHLRERAKALHLFLTNL